MKKACLCDPLVYEILSPALQQNRGIVETLVEGDWNSLGVMTSEAQLLYPDLAAKALHDIDSRSEQVAAGLWNNEDFVKAWVTVMGAYSVPALQNAILNNAKIGLWIAEATFVYFDDHVPADSTRSNKDFMTQAVNKNGRLAHGAAGALRRDFDFAMLSYGKEGAREALCVELDGWNAHTSNDRKALLQTVLAEAERLVEVHHSFTEGFLYEISDHSENPTCPLPVLSRYDHESSTALKQNIAEFLGVPTGEYLGTVRRVVENLDLLKCCCGRCR